MIVPKPDPRALIKIHLEENLTENVTGWMGNVISLTVQEIENIYTTEESRYIENMVNQFYHNYKAINVGPQVVKHFISLCKNPGPLPEYYYIMMNGIFRSELYTVNFILNPIISILGFLTRVGPLVHQTKCI